MKNVSMDEAAKRTYPDQRASASFLTAILPLFVFTFCPALAQGNSLASRLMAQVNVTEPTEAHSMHAGAQVGIILAVLIVFVIAMVILSFVCGPSSVKKHQDAISSLLTKKEPSSDNPPPNSPPRSRSVSVRGGGHNYGDKSRARDSVGRGSVGRESEACDSVASFDEPELRQEMPENGIADASLLHPSYTPMNRRHAT